MSNAASTLSLIYDCFGIGRIEFRVEWLESDSLEANLPIDEVTDMGT